MLTTPLGRHPWVPTNSPDSQSQPCACVRLGAAPHFSGNKALLEELARYATLAMLALLYSCWLLVAHASASGTVPHTQEEQIRDMHAKVTEIWQALTQRRVVQDQPTGVLYASCQVQPSARLDVEQPRVRGTIVFKQPGPGAKLEAFFDLEGFPAEANSTNRAIHVHEFGDLSQGCDSTGPHYNPLAVPHPQHPGDFGNFAVRGDGRLWKHRTGLAASLAGPHSIVGRAVVVHAGVDDMGNGNNPASLENGNAGSRLACCVVGTSGVGPWERQAQEHMERKKRRRESECKTT